MEYAATDCGQSHKCFLFILSLSVWLHYRRNI